MKVEEAMVDDSIVVMIEDTMIAATMTAVTIDSMIVVVMVVAMTDMMIVVVEIVMHLAMIVSEEMIAVTTDVIVIVIEEIPEVHVMIILLLMVVARSSFGSDIHGVVEGIRVFAESRKINTKVNCLVLLTWVRQPLIHQEWLTRCVRASNGDHCPLAYEYGVSR